MSLARGGLSQMAMKRPLQALLVIVLGVPCALARHSPLVLSSLHQEDRSSATFSPLTSLTPSVLSSGSDEKSHAITRPTFAATRALSIRGGASPELRAFAEAATVATGVSAAMTYLFPSAATAGLYGLPNTSPLVVWLIRALGGSLAMIAIQAYCILFREMSYTRAVGFGCLPFIINEIRTLVLNETRQWDMPPWGLLFISLPISSSCAYTLMTMSDKPLAKNVVKAFAFWVLAGNGLPLGLAPEAAANGWGINYEEEGVLEGLRLIGFADIAAALFMMMLDKEVDSVMAFVLSFSLLSGLMTMECVPRRFASQE